MKDIMKEKQNSLRFLIADDDPGDRKLIRIAIKRAMEGSRAVESMGSFDDYEVLEASDGIEAVQMATEHTPDMIILDIIMPGGDGFSVFDRLDKNQETMMIPIVVVSGNPRQSNEFNSRRSGAIEYVDKANLRSQLPKIIVEYFTANLC